MLLAIDTATRYLGLALHDGHSIIAEQTWRAGTQHNRLLAPSVRNLFDICAVNPQDLGAVAVCKGPGSYTGLRIGVAFAKAVATTNKLPLVGVPTLDILAAAQLPPAHTASDETRLLPVVQAGRGRIISAEYAFVYNRWVSMSDPQISDWQTLLSNRDAPLIITGEVDESGRSLIEQIAAQHKHSSQAGPRITLANAAQRLRRTGYLAQEAWRIYGDSSQDMSAFEPAGLLPVYLKSEPEAASATQTDDAP